MHARTRIEHTDDTVEAPAPREPAAEHDEFLVGLLDTALRDFASRELVRGTEVVDLLLDLRGAVVFHATLARALEPVPA